MNDLLAKPERRIAIGLFLLLAILYLPFAGNYGMWDPWETHYSEVARQMLMRSDYVSLWWPGSPQDRNEFWSKPVLTFWLMAIGMAVAGLERVGHAFDGEMATSWTVEWAVRIPFILCAAVTVWAVWELVRRLAGRRAALWSAVVLATASQFFYIARQAMTDMAFVAPMAVALSLSGLALIGPEEEMNGALPRRSVRVAGRALSWPHSTSFYALAALVLLTIVPQLVLISVQVHLAFTVGHRAIRMSGVVAMLPYIVVLAVYAWLAMHAWCKRQIYFHIAFLMCGLATLAKGPAGVAMPVMGVLLYLIARGEWRRLLPPPGDANSPKWVDRVAGWPGFFVRLVVRNPLEIGLGVLVFVAVTFPWYHAMLIRHGMGFWNEFIGDNYVHRAAGRHGDRGTFEYYLLQIGHGMFPWSGVVPAAALASLAKLSGDSPRAKLRGFAMAWFIVMFGVVSLVNTKFHHYILPGLPALAILAGLYLDELFTRPRVSDALALLLVGVPFLGLAARDLAMFPARLTWLFDYDYVNAPNGGRPWPMDPQYQYGTRIAAFAICAVLATLILGVIALVRARRGAVVPVEDDGDVRPPASPIYWLALALAPVATLIAAERWQPAFGDGLPHPLANGWILVAVAGSGFLLLLVGRGLGSRALRAPTIGLLVVGAMGCAWTAWGLDRLLTDLSPHWSQKHVVAAYYRLRKDESEPLVAWQMYWRGETFYTKNAIYDHRLKQDDKTVFLGDHNAEKMQAYFKSHSGRRVFFIVERSRFESLRSLLPEAARPTLKEADTSNNKVFLAVATLPPDGAAPPAPPAPPAPKEERPAIAP